MERIQKWHVVVHQIVEKKKREEGEGKTLLFDDLKSWKVYQVRSVVY